jgi:hypothetical protein
LLLSDAVPVAEALYVECQRKEAGLAGGIGGERAGCGRVDLAATLRLSLLTALLFAYCPDCFRHGSSKQRAQFNPPPALLWVFDKFTDYEWGERSSYARDMTERIRTNSACRRLRALKTVPVARFRIRR